LEVRPQRRERPRHSAALEDRLHPVRRSEKPQREEPWELLHQPVSLHQRVSLRLEQATRRQHHPEPLPHWPSPFRQALPFHPALPFRREVAFHLRPEPHPPEPHFLVLDSRLVPAPPKSIPQAPCRPATTTTILP
jgi:hypothetical protein